MYPRQLLRLEHLAVLIRKSAQEGMGGEYICVTGCIIAQLTRAWIEPFQPNNPSGHLTYIYSTIGQVMSCAVFKHKHIH